MKNPQPSILHRVILGISSLGFSAVLFGLLMGLTYLGTLYQVEHGLFAAQAKYFESFFVVHEVGDWVAIPLPGAYLLLILLFINLLAGGIVRMRKGWNQAGILVAHAGILLLLAGGFVTYQFSVNGHLTLYEDEQSGVFKSYHEWEVAVARLEPDGARREFVIPGEDFTHLRGERSRAFQADDMPFTLVLGNYMGNSTPQPAMQARRVRGPVVDGVHLQELEPERSQERNVAGLHAAVIESDTTRHDMLLWGLQQQPAGVEMAGATWTFDLRRKQWQLPFTITLDKFTRELHPRTNMPSAFTSEVTKVEDGSAERRIITMNQPLRHQGYTLYQASWGPSDAGPNDALFSSFAVVRNPAEQAPMLACIVTTLGLLVHFLIKLRKYLIREQKRMA